MVLSKDLFRIASLAEDKRKYKFAEQLNGATLSITNNIAEGSGSISAKDFSRYLSFARGSVFEVVNILHVFEQQEIISSNERLVLYPQLISLSKKIYNFKKSLMS